MSEEIIMTKGEKVDMSKGHETMSALYVGAGWDINKGVGSEYDLDIAAIVVNGNGKALSSRHFVFFNNKATPNGSVQVSEDNLTGEGEGDDEHMIVKLSEVEPEATEIHFVINIHDAVGRGQNFGQVENAFIRFAENEETGEKIAHFDLSEDYSGVTQVEVGKLYRKDDGWKFQADGTGFNQNLTKWKDQYLN